MRSGIVRSSDLGDNWTAEYHLTVGMIACGAAKLDRPAPARDLYTGNLFRASRAHVEKRCARWFVLSAKHGLVTPDTVLAPYDVQLSGMPANDRVMWQLRVARQVLDALAGQDVELLVLAGVPYRAFLPLVPFPARVPMAGMGIGKQLAWLKEERCKEPR